MGQHRRIGRGELYGCLCDTVLDKLYSAVHTAPTCCLQVGVLGEKALRRVCMEIASLLPLAVLEPNLRGRKCHACEEEHVQSSSNGKATKMRRRHQR